MAAEDLRSDERKQIDNDIQKWRNDAFETAARIVERHLGHRDAGYIAIDIRALIRPQS